MKLESLAYLRSLRRFEPFGVVAGWVTGKLSFSVQLKKLLQLKICWTIQSTTYNKALAAVSFYKDWCLGLVLHSFSLLWTCYSQTKKQKSRTFEQKKRNQNWIKQRNCYWILLVVFVRFDLLLNIDLKCVFKSEKSCTTNSAAGIVAWRSAHSAQNGIIVVKLKQLDL